MIKSLLQTGYTAQEVFSMKLSELKLLTDVLDDQDEGLTEEFLSLLM